MLRGGEKQEMARMYDFAIIGGGASGMAAAVAASHAGDKVLLLERGPALGRKLSASGNGRCNLLNRGNALYYGDTSFADKVFSFFPEQALERFWDSLGLFLTEDAERRVYPGTYYASSVTDALKTALKLYGVDIILQSQVISIKKDNNDFLIQTENDSFNSKRVLIAAGGPAYPKLGGTSSGYGLLQSFGHQIIPAKPALCPIKTDLISISGLSGIRVKGTVALYDSKGKECCRHYGELLFTDYGISGICAMQCARWINGANGGFYIIFDLLSFYGLKVDSFTNILKERRKRFAELSPEYLLNGILLPKLSFAILKQAGIRALGRKSGQISDNELALIAKKMNNYRLEVIDTKGLSEAQVTAGGAVCKDFSPQTLESILIPGLHASGEILNVDGECGGYNLMFAFATGILAGLNNRTVKEWNI